jgi:hypothetical protein
MHVTDDDDDDDDDVDEQHKLLRIMGVMLGFVLKRLLTVYL